MLDKSRESRLHDLELIATWQRQLADILNVTAGTKVPGEIILLSGILQTNLLIAEYLIRDKP